jgi:hypothetical protein
MRVARPHLPASLVVLLAAALLPAAGASASSSSPSSSRPHLVYVLSDNLGWANVGYHFDSPEVVTPHIDALVQSGVELDRLYTCELCEPRRKSGFLRLPLPLWPPSSDLLPLSNLPAVDLTLHAC